MLQFDYAQILKWIGRAALRSPDSFWLIELVPVQHGLAGLVSG
jgi:hypothetical protein